MPSFDVVSEIDRQELRNAIDQAQRELANRFDFKNTNSAIEQNELVLTLRTSSEDRLRALRTLLEGICDMRGCVTWPSRAKSWMSETSPVWSIRSSRSAIAISREIRGTGAGAEAGGAASSVARR